MDERERRARGIQEAIRRVLLHDWDPIGVAEFPQPQDEYDSYIRGVYRLLASGASASEIAEHLYEIEIGPIGYDERLTAPATSCMSQKNYCALTCAPAGRRWWSNVGRDHVEREAACCYP